MQSLITYISNFDYTILHAVQSIGPRWEGVAYFISHGVGSYAIMLAAFFLGLLFIDKWRVALELMIISLISYGALVCLKHYFGIERPYVIDPSLVYYDNDASFALPSGHALMSVVILGWVALRHPKSRVLTWGSISLILFIGISRVYLGVHYPSQVVAGWLFGILFLYLFRVAHKRLWSPFEKKLGKRR
jgi:membrane-associated phospholipid phosphatase